MARLFDDAANDGLEYASAILTGPPFTLACWFKLDDAASLQTLMAIFTGALTNHHFRLDADGAAVGDPVRAATRSTSTAVASTTTGYSTNTWHHAAGVFASASDRRAFIDGGSKGTSTSTVTPNTPTRTGIGRLRNAVQHASGAIAEAGIWSVALEDSEIAALGRGLSLRRVRPESLVAYWPIWGLHSPEIDLRAGLYPLTVTGTTRADHAPVRPFSSRYWGSFPLIEEVGGPTFQPAWASQANSLIGVGAVP